jgi:hypothetical protein
MAKRQTFADKVKKKQNVNVCPNCNQPVAHTLVVYPEPTVDGKSYKMRSRNVAVCKCNENSVLA